jgi:predicted Fe-S protein YdhL (DUF1289 family)
MPGTLPSPCIQLCVLDQSSGLCLGCLRSGDEIAAWPKADDRLRAEILVRVAKRRAANQQAKDAASTPSPD